MIIDRINRLKYYSAVSGLEKIDTALSVIEQLQEWEEGVHYPFDGGFIFFQKGVTKPLSESQFEAHKKYIDVQLVLAGSEYLALESVENVAVAVPYNPEKDVEKYNGATHHMMKINQGMGYICFPWDVHKAVFHTDQATTFTKAVIKLEVEN